MEGYHINILISKTETLLLLKPYPPPWPTIAGNHHDSDAPVTTATTDLPTPPPHLNLAPPWATISVHNYSAPPTTTLDAQHLHLLSIIFNAPAANTTNLQLQATVTNHAPPSRASSAPQQFASAPRRKHEQHHRAVNAQPSLEPFTHLDAQCLLRRTPCTRSEKKNRAESQHQRRRSSTTVDEPAPAVEEQPSFPSPFPLHL